MRAGLVLAAAVLLSGGAAAQAPTPFGLWSTGPGNSDVRLYPCGDALCGDIATMPQGDRLDTANDEPHLRNRSLLGLRIIDGFRPDPRNPAVWKDGTIYNPEDGDTVGEVIPLTIELRSADQLRIQGCLIVCRSRTWTRVGD